MALMNTYTGILLDPMDMKPEQVSIQDIAHSLSLLCRGGGHLKWFYSVGQHSVNCAEEAAARGFSRRLIRACLLHDASEAYISDIIRPVKVHLANYMEIEDRIMKTIWIRFGLEDLTEEENKAWKQIDDDILENELNVMLESQDYPHPARLLSVPDFQERSHEEIEKRFLELAARLEQ